MADLKSSFKTENIKARFKAFSDRIRSMIKTKNATGSANPGNGKESKTFLSYLKSRTFLVNLLLIISVYLGLFLIMLISMNLITQHNKTVKVPDLNKHSLLRAKSQLANRHLEYVVFDSIFIEDLPTGVIIDQHPKGGAEVKKGRKVYFTINARSAGQIPMPDLIGLTFRAAQPRMIASGLKLGSLRYKYDMAVNEVLGMEIAGEPIQAGEIIMKGTAIDLILGKGLGSDRVSVPNLIGLSYEEAQARAAEAYFTTSSPIPDETVSERSMVKPFVYKQLPESSPERAVQLGSQIILWTTTDSSKIQLIIPSDSLTMDNPEDNIYNGDDFTIDEENPDYDYTDPTF
ncbi:MAG: PASTA domain-containing protein [Bacteroidales bacterium]|nr:PASTA domain-containing protein [Bacteroidales bacterium]